MIRNTNSYMKNWLHFKQYMNDEHLEDSVTLVSFVIVNLLTNVPVDKVLEVIKNKLQTNSILSE